MSDYPAVTLRPGETSTINLRLQNYDMPPERLNLVGVRRAGRMDGDAVGRRAAGRGGDAGDQRQRVAGVAARRAEERSRLAPRR